MAIKHLKPRTIEEQLMVLKKLRLNKELLKLCKRDEQFLNGIVGLLDNIDLTLTDDERVAQEKNKIEWINKFFEVFKPLLRDKYLIYDVKVKIKPIKL
jgi:hypothetical protein